MLYLINIYNYKIIYISDYSNLETLKSVHKIKNQ